MRRWTSMQTEICLTSRAKEHPSRCLWRFAAADCSTAKAASTDERQPMLVRPLFFHAYERGYWAVNITMSPDLKLTSIGLLHLISSMAFLPRK